MCCMHEMDVLHLKGNSVYTAHITMITQYLHSAYLRVPFPKPALWPESGLSFFQVTHWLLHENKQAFQFSSVGGGMKRNSRTGQCSCWQSLRASIGPGVVYRRIFFVGADALPVFFCKQRCTFWVHVMPCIFMCQWANALYSDLSILNILHIIKR